jgi:hypothetical protein
VLKIRHYAKRQNILAFIMSDFTADIFQIRELEFSKFCIPNYQRPYVWSVTTPKNRTG